MSILDNTRIGKLTDAAFSRSRSGPLTPESLRETQDQLSVLAMAAMGVEYIHCAVASGARTPQESLEHYITFAKFANPAMFATREKAEVFRVTLISALKDARDIVKRGEG